MYWFLKRLYRFITYNRKVIAAKKCGQGKFDCSPQFSFFYRILFLIVFLLFNTAMLWLLHKQLLAGLSFYHLSVLQLQAAHFAFVVLNVSLSTIMGKRKAIEYLGQVSILALMAVMLLTSLMLLHSVIHLAEWQLVFCLGIFTVIIIQEYFRRMNYANVFPDQKKIVAANFFCLATFLVYVFH